MIRSQRELLSQVMPLVPCLLLASAASANDLDAGSLLVFPLVDSGPGKITILTVTNIDEAFTNPIDVEFEFRDGDMCSKTNHLETLTPGDTFTVYAASYSFSTVEGYASVWVVSDHTPLRNAVVNDTLIGTSSVVDALAQKTYSVNAIPFQGLGNGSLTDLDGDGERDFDGVEYSELPDRLVFPRFFGQQTGVESELVLLNLTGRLDSTAIVDFLITNDNEEIFSSQFSFECWSRTPLLNISGVFGNSFLASFTNHDPTEIVGATSQESGWIEIDGAQVIQPGGALVTNDGALLACQIETISGESEATLPFGLGLQSNGSTIGEDPCEIEDLFEPNDTCQTAFVVPSPGEFSLNGLTVQDPLFGPSASTDWFEISIPSNHLLTVDANFTHAEVDLDLQLVVSCGAVLDFSQSATDGESVSFLNSSIGAVLAQVRCFVSSSSSTDCGAYSLSIVTVPDPCLSVDDAFEDNDICDGAVPRGANSVTTGLRSVQSDSDWWAVDVPAGSTQTVDVLFPGPQGDLFLIVRTSCSGGLGGLLALVQTVGNSETFSFTNTGTSTETYFFGVGISSAVTGICADYSLEFTNTSPPGTLVPYCFGDGVLVNCPCGNNSSTGHPGGCAHENGNGAILTGTGNPFLSGDTLHFDLSNAVPNSFALLVSGVNPLPQVGCIGCGIPEFDGLRCAGGDFRRLGSRTIVATGSANNGWGSPAGPPGGLGSASNAVAGQTRRYFAFFRTDLASSCMTGQNSSNGVSVTWAP